MTDKQTADLRGRIAEALRGAADAVAALKDKTDVNVAEYQRYDFRQRCALGDAESLLRRLADEAQQQPDTEALRAKVGEATATLRRIRSTLRTLRDQGATGRTYYEEITEALAGPRPDRYEDAAEVPQPDDTDLTETDIDRMMAAGVPVQIVTAPPDTRGAEAQQPDTETRPSWTPGPVALARAADWATKRQDATVDPAMCPRCKGDNSEAFQLCTACATPEPPADRAALARVRTVLETEAVVGRSALEYRGLIASALMGGEAQQQPDTETPTCPDPIECAHEAALGQAQQQVKRVRDVCDQLRRASVLADGEPHTDRERGIVQAVTRVMAALDKPAAGSGRVAAEARPETVCSESVAHIADAVERSAAADAGEEAPS